MPFKSKDEARAYKRVYMRKYRHEMKGAATAKLAKVQALIRKWEKEIKDHAPNSPRYTKAAQLLQEIKEILRGE